MAAAAAFNVSSSLLLASALPVIVWPGSRVPSARVRPNAAKPANAAMHTKVMTFMRRDARGASGSTGATPSRSDRITVAARAV